MTPLTITLFSVYHLCIMYKTHKLMQMELKITWLYMICYAFN